MNYYRRGLLTLLLFTACSACVTRERPPQCATFFSLSTDKQDEVFRTYELNDQLIIYRCGMNERPPYRYLAGYIAERGESAIPLLLERLALDRDELTQVSIIAIFEVMSEKGYLRNRSDVFDAVRKTINQMRIQVFKDMASRSFDRMMRLSK